MNLFKPHRAIEIAGHSGQMRVDINPRPTLIQVSLEVIGIVVFVFVLKHNWSSMAVWLRVLFAWGLVSTTVALVYQLTGSEVLEFDGRRFSVSKEFSMWSRRSEYPVSDCTELQWREHTGEGDEYGLQCKVGRRTVRFGRYISEEEAVEILTALQKFLPDVAQHMCSGSESKKHFTVLDLHGPTQDASRN